MARQNSETHGVTQFVFSIAGLSAVMWVCALTSILGGVAKGKGFPLGEKFPAFSDILIYRYRFMLYHSAAFFRPHVNSKLFPWPPPAFAYPPADAPLYAAFYKFAQPETVYIALIAVWTLVICVATWRILRRALTSAQQTNAVFAAFCLFSFPLVFLAQRANLELFVWMLITAAIMLYARGQRVGAAALIGLAASLKLYPILLLGVFLARGRSNIKALLCGVSVAVAATALAVWYSGPSFMVALHGFINGVIAFNAQHGEAPRHIEAIFDHSLFAPFKLPSWQTEVAARDWTTPYYLVAGVLTTCLFFWRVRGLPFLNRFTFLSTAMISLPPVSYNYTIVHLYLPLLMLLLMLLMRSSITGRIALMCILCTMLPYGILGGGTFLYGGVIQAALLLALMIATTVSPWPLQPVMAKHAA